MLLVMVPVLNELSFQKRSDSDRSDYKPLRQGLTLVHFSAQLEPFLTQETTYIP